MKPSEIISLSEWPLVIVSGDKRLSDDGFIRYIETMELIRRRCEPWAFILDASIGWPLTSKQRRWYADSARCDADLIARYLRCAAFVVPVAVHRGYLHAIHRMAPPPYRWKIVTSLRAARAWVDQTWPPSERGQGALVAGQSDLATSPLRHRA